METTGVLLGNSGQLRLYWEEGHFHKKIKPEKNKKNREGQASHERKEKSANLLAG